MSWMAEAANVVASRQAAREIRAGSYVAISIFDAMKFIAPSKVGDRVVLRARITRVFHQSMEICVDVKAGTCEGGREAMVNINSGYITAAVVDAKAGLPLPLRTTEPRLNDTVAQEEHDAALVRRKLRIQRRQMFSLRPDAMQFSLTLLEDLSICNIMGLLRVAHSVSISRSDLEPTTTPSPAASPCHPHPLF